MIFVCLYKIEFMFFNHIIKSFIIVTDSFFHLSKHLNNDIHICFNLGIKIINLFGSGLESYFFAILFEFFVIELFLWIKSILLYKRFIILHGMLFRLTVIILII
jgi:hypothetical protein